MKIYSNHKYLYIIVIICVISIFGCGNHQKEETLPEHPTFAKDIAPILEKNCLPCHRENGAAPFVLTSFAAVKKRAKTIAKVTQQRIMPPWPADPNYSHFIGEKILSSREIALIQQWVEQGAVEGNEKYIYRQNTIVKSSLQIGRAHV